MGPPVKPGDDEEVVEDGKREMLFCGGASPKVKENRGRI
jgi:hypothetical protein